MFLKELCELDGVSGNEKPIRDYLIAQLADKVDYYQIDRIGNLIFEKGSALTDGPHVLLCAHMDEVGLFITEITTEGYLRFQTVGGIDPQILISKTVRIGSEGLVGVLGSKAIHLQKAEERKKILDITDLYIDIGANSKEEAEAVVHLGDYVAFVTTFEAFGLDMYKAKAFDDRVGCALLIDLLTTKAPCHLTVAFTVQEEIGLRGSKVISNYLQADLAIVVEATAATDIQDFAREDWSVEVGKGPACSLMDKATIYQPELIRQLAEIASEQQIPIQYRQSTKAANDAGNIHQAGQGIPTITISIPCRNLHSMSGIISKNDYENGRKLLGTMLRQIQRFVPNKQCKEVGDDKR